jgi:hypothetical protein
MNISGTSTEGIFYIENNEHGTLFATDFTMKNSNLGYKHAFDYASTVPGSMVLENFHFENLTLNTDDSLIRAQRLSNMSLKNITFTRIYQSDPIDSSNKMISISSLDLNTTGAFVIDSITAED